jgi:hypothetical protein
MLKNSSKNIHDSLNRVTHYCLFNETRKYSNEMPKSDAIECARGGLGIIYSNIDFAFKDGEMLYNSIPDRSPKTSINKDIIFDFYKNEKTEFEVVVFLAFAAIRSILQRQPFVKVTNEYLLGRMAGNAKKGDALPYWLEIYKTRYQLDKIKNELQLNWGLKLYANHVRGFYVSFKMDIRTLAFHVEKRRKKTRERELAAIKKEAKEMAIAEIYKTSKLKAV